MIGPEFPRIAEEILSTISREIPEYVRPLEGSFGRGIHRGVGEALDQFVGLIRNPDADREPSRKIYLELGRGEFNNGRALDALQSAYRIGARIAWRRIAAASLAAKLDGKTLSLLAESIFVYIDELSADSTEGYAEAQSERLGERLRRERELVIAMLRQPPLAEADLKALGSASGWRVPKTIAALICHESDLAEITRALPQDVVSASVDGYGCVAVPDANGPGRPRLLDDAVAGRSSILGADVPPHRLGESWQLVRTARRAVESGALPDRGLLRAEDHLVDLALFKSRGLIARLREKTLKPLDDLTPKSRQRMSETALAYLEHRGNAAEMARYLEIHPQTARYRIAKLRDLFGDKLDQPEERLALELSLRGEAPDRG